MFVCPLLPAAGPDELEQRAQLEQVTGGGGRKEVGYAVDRMEAPHGGLWLGPCRLGGAMGERSPEERDHAVDIDHQERPGPGVGAAGARGCSSLASAKVTAGTLPHPLHRPSPAPSGQRRLDG